MIHFLLLASMIVGIGMADSSKDKDECTAQLTGLASCIPYVEDRNDPDLGGFVINVTLALNLPTVCDSPVNISKCPELLHMDPKSKEAQVFYQLNNGSSNMAPIAAPSPSDGASNQARSTTQKNGAFSKDKRLFGLDVLVIGLSVWFLLVSTAGNFFI
ncbi:hypothetical protein P8452_69661 [Trifolium repens]|nr:hypothetical protein P8452_69661 [Trifolium repens]